MKDMKDWYDSALLFDVYTGINDGRFREAVNEIFETLPESCKLRPKARSRDTLKQVLVNLMLGNAWGVPIAYSRNRNDYRHHERYGLLFFKYKRMMAVVDSLNDAGLIEQKQGINYKDYSRSSRMWATDKLVDRIGMDSFQITQSQPQEIIQLRDTNKKLIDYEESPFTDEARRNLQHYNQSISKAQITVEPSDIFLRRLLHDKRYVSYRRMLTPLYYLKGNILIEPYTTPYSITKTQRGLDEIKINYSCFHRVFSNGSFQEGGRFYGAHHQKLPKEIRQTLRINGEPTVELDYSSLHVRMLYHQDRLKCPDEPYGSGTDRELFKSVSLNALNAKSEGKALKAIRWDFVKSGEDVPSNLGNLLERFKKIHAPISHHFFSGAGLRLQNIDSKITEYVILEMLSEDVPCLPVHDSYIVPKSAESLLKTTMETAYERYVGGQPVIH